MMQAQSPTGGLTFINADTSAGTPASVRIADSRICALNGPPAEGDRVIDLRGDRLLPGLINAHDHLQLNNLPALEHDKRYRHVRDWITDVDARRKTDGAFEARVAIARDERLLIGAIKNLLSGVTTVAHHDPAYAMLSSADFPVRVVTESGWSHSLYVDGDDQVRRSYQGTPADWPWIIHAAEGLDEDASREFDRLEALGCVAANTLIVHGIALDHSQRARLADASGGLIWCPSSNLRLFGRTAEVAELASRGRVALGTDSRLSGARDLLEELRIARDLNVLDERSLEAAVTTHSAGLFRLADRGALKIGHLADILILPAGLPLSAATRADVRLVLLGGLGRYADTDYARALAPAAHWAEIRVDGRSKMLASGIAAALSGAAANEAGVELSNVAWRAA
jgi:cytosine/adenosine deaminase-related metal-dependent hydrolase